MAFAATLSVGMAGLVAGCGPGEVLPPLPDLAMAGGDGPAADLSGKPDLAQPPQEDMEEPDLATADDMPLPDDMPPGPDMPVADDMEREQPDMAVKPCGNNKGSCGMPGMCVDCAGNTLGEACVNSACGCNTSADCPKGSACDPNKKQCADACAGGLECNGGCCDGKVCIAGTENVSCGNDGKACKPCGGGTPSCDSGACTSKCIAGMLGQSGVCGQGFCCNANACAAVGASACGASGAACTDCAKSMAGPTCLPNGSCGCAVAKDCPPGQACKAGVCGTVCDANTPCNGGCCSAGKCDVGNTPTACALGGAACGTCVGNAKGGACVSVNNATQCGCNTQADCPANTACDPATKQCGAKCDTNNPCNGGCCSAAMNGACQKGLDLGACGANGGLCLACGNNDNGHVCVAAQGGGQCGCTKLGDCPISSVACDAMTKTCNNKCSAQAPCQFGCCDNPAGGTCRNGTVAGACGKGGACIDCTKSVLGALCRANQVCGCDVAADCPVGQACNVGTHVCENKCAANQLCNGGCCSNPLGGTCLAGTAAGACGNKNACVDCASSLLGKVCIMGGSCGCNSSADCGALQACDVQRKVCTNVCNANQLCNGGCCLNGACAIGTANSACGGTGAACAVCKDGKPTCDKGACSAKCGGLSDGICNTGNCCSAGFCVPGNKQIECGYRGTCTNCASQSTGTKCIAPNNSTDWFCGCEAKTDCLAANAKAGIAGYACDTANKNCTSLCGVNNITACNGGCCSAPNGSCRAGNADAACGVNGGYCNNCGTSCNPGPKCNPANGSCGCGILDDCFNTFSCYGGVGHRESCSVPKGSCCIPSWFNGNVWPDSGNPANCCTGMSQNGKCTCVDTGLASSGDASKCCSQHQTNGTCTCLANNAPCLFEFDSNGECCSGQCVDVGFFDFVCVPSVKGEPCQSNAGCQAPLTCVNKKCA